MKLEGYVARMEQKWENLKGRNYFYDKGECKGMPYIDGAPGCELSSTGPRERNKWRAIVSNF
jgi:hypothetical protein